MQKFKNVNVNPSKGDVQIAMRPFNLTTRRFRKEIDIQGAEHRLNYVNFLHVSPSNIQMKNYDGCLYFGCRFGFAIRFKITVLFFLRISICETLHFL